MSPANGVGVKPKKKSHYSQIGVDPVVYADLTKMKAEKAATFGIGLSWNAYFGLIVRDWKEAKKKR